jgi:signal recognition particle subunit SRP19
MIVWPASLDSSKSRIGGRKIAKTAAIPTPRLEEISDAAKRLSFETEIIPGKARPKSWWERGGYAIITKKGAKADLLRALAGEIKKARAAKVEQEERKR